MSDEHSRDLLRIVVAQICQTIGYSSTQTTPMELLEDTMHKFLLEFTRSLRLQTEHYNRTDANLNDACLTLSSLSINIHELLDYINNVEPVPFVIDIPKFPVHKESNLNFLKPGSKEVLIRPVHIYEHLPPILPPEPMDLPPLPQYLYNGNLTEKSAATVADYDATGEISAEDSTFNIRQRTSSKTELTLSRFMCINKQNIDRESIPPYLKISSTSSNLFDFEGRPTRELSSVVMTTGGFISPAIEGKLPDAMIPDLIEKLQGLDAPLSAPHPASRNLIENAAYNPSNITSSIKPEHELSPSYNAVNIDKNTYSGESNTLESSALGSTNRCEKSFSTSINTPEKKFGAFLLTTLHPQQIPKMTARLLKKAKKKSPIVPLASHVKLTQLNSRQIIRKIPNKVDKTDKAERKCIKILQKLAKSTKSSENEIVDLVGSDKKFKNFINPALFACMPPGPERLQLEKLLKKQAKHKQKLLKQHISTELSNRSQEDLNFNLQTNFLQEKTFAKKNFCSEPQSLSFELKQLKDTKEPKTVKELEAREVSLSPTNFLCQNQAATSDIFVSAQDQVLNPTTLLINSVSDISGDISQISSDLQDKKPYIEKKLSTEPDRSKLNILKKISKQKVSKIISQNMNLSSNPMYTSNESQVINLPPGTTITPAPSKGDQYIHPLPDNRSVIAVDKFSESIQSQNTNVAGNQTRIIAANSEISLFGTINEHEDNLAFLNKPKKRGRKPGSKNQTKFSGLIESSNNSSLKKIKKTKMDKKIGESNFPIQSANSLNSEPLAMTNQFGSLNRLNSSFSMSLQNKFSLNVQKVIPTQVKERKERKKFKHKDAPSIDITSDKLKSKSSINLPTREEVYSINKKLLRMDTVIKPAATVSSLPMTTNDYSKTIPELALDIHSTKSATSFKSPISKRRVQQRNSLSVSQSNVTSSFIPTSGPGFPNIQANMLSMLSLYPFSPRPGLIPAPSLFPPPGIGSFKNTSSTTSTSSVILPGYLPFPIIKPHISRKLSTEGSDNNGNLLNLAEPVPLSGDRRYCNVAPLVPETMKLTPPDSMSDRKVSINVECDYPKTPKIRKSPTPSEIISDTLLKSLENTKTPESSSVGSKSIPATPTHGEETLLHTIETFSQRIPNSLDENISISASEKLNKPKTPEKSPYISNAYVHSVLLKEIKSSANSQQIQSTINDDPIEVSDDSVDTPTKPFQSFQINKTKLEQNFFKPSLISSDISHMDNIFVPNISDTTLLNKESRKNKKSAKLDKKTIVLSPNSTTMSADVFSTDKTGVGKLAGGADLIPLAETGLAYSSKTIPATSLTIATTPAYPIQKRDYGQSNIFDSLTITPAAVNSDLLKSRKEHKKIKKLKEGKLKKKKDKKDKHKSKERPEKSVHKSERVLKEKDFEKWKEKDILKKLKKEKKKEKQRMTIDSLSVSSALNLNKQSLVRSVFDTSNEQISTNQLSPKSTASSVSTTAATTSLVPKITLKLGSSQSPTQIDDSQQKLAQSSVLSSTHREKRESSPELARISPLVTRPPKPKLNPSDITTVHSTALVACSVTNSSNSESSIDNTKTITSVNVLSTSTHPLVPPPNPWLSGGTLTASSVLLPQQLSKIPKSNEHISSIAASAQAVELVAATSTARSIDRQSPVLLISETSRPSSYIDAEGNRIWICPACGKVDDGSAMIGCDGCDAWYHWVCVGILVAPKDNEDWFCRVCITKKRILHSTDKKRKRNKKK